MKYQTLPVKRRPVSKGIMHRLHAVTARGRRQRVAAAAAAGAPEIEEEYHGSKISRSLTIIFLIHIVAIALIFIHQQFLQGRVSESTDATSAKALAPAASASRRGGEPPRLSNGEKPYIVRAGDNYSRIAAAEQVDEAELREINSHVDIGPGLILKIPPRRIIAEEPPEVAAIRERNEVAADRGQVVDVSNAPRAVMVRPAGDPPRPATTGAARHHVVKPGESVYRIAKQYHISQEALMKANGITDPRKLRAETRLTIPAN